MAVHIERNQYRKKWHEVYMSELGIRLVAISAISFVNHLEYLIAEHVR